ncbi:hypothetical protein ACICHK_43700 (plasmid) [Streptomyces sp. AHU1]|uniref:hypothetical protein n=1 Tax=Streptomyces sp. AHU1 TaxID=3377215 RepID=UPI0038779CFC
METVVKAVVALKVVGLVLFVVVLAISFAYTLVVGPDDPESSHGYTAVCRDGTVLAPPWNQCGKEHGYLDHWTTGPAPSTTPAVPLEPSMAVVPDTEEDDWLTAYPGGCAAGTPLASPWDPCDSDG